MLGAMPSSRALSLLLLLSLFDLASSSYSYESGNTHGYGVGSVGEGRDPNAIGDYELNGCKFYQFADMRTKMIESEQNTVMVKCIATGNFANGIVLNSIEYAYIKCLNEWIGTRIVKDENGNYDQKEEKIADKSIRIYPHCANSPPQPCRSHDKIPFEIALNGWLFCTPPRTTAEPMAIKINSIPFERFACNSTHGWSATRTDFSLGEGAKNITYKLGGPFWFPRLECVAYCSITQREISEFIYPGWTMVQCGDPSQQLYYGNRRVKDRAFCTLDKGWEDEYGTIPADRWTTADFVCGEKREVQSTTTTGETTVVTTTDTVIVKPCDFNDNDYQKSADNWLSCGRSSGTGNLMAIKINSVEFDRFKCDVILGWEATRTNLTNGKQSQMISYALGNALWAPRLECVEYCSTTQREITEFINPGWTMVQCGESSQQLYYGNSRVKNSAFCTLQNGWEDEEGIITVDYWTKAHFECKHEGEDPTTTTTTVVTTPDTVIDAKTMIPASGPAESSEISMGTIIGYTAGGLLVLLIIGAVVIYFLLKKGQSGSDDEISGEDGDSVESTSV